MSHLFDPAKQPLLERNTQYMQITTQRWAEDAQLFTLENNQGMTVKITDFGATLVALTVPDRNGNSDDVLLGFEALEPYTRPGPYLGSTVGRYANRISQGKFTLDGQQYALAKNNGPNHLHGGLQGFSHRLWQAETVQETARIGVRFSLHSPDGDEGYPGALDVTVIYWLTADNQLVIDYQAQSEQTTVINLTNHGYFNLAGAAPAGSPDAKTVHEHELTLKASRYTPTDDTGIPTGELAPVAGTPMDFNQAKPLGQELAQLTQTGGYDHNFVLDNWDSTLREFARVYEPVSGRVMQLATTLPGVQLYTGNYLGGLFPKHGGFCLETQFFPDSPNKPQFPSTVLRAGETWAHSTVFSFGCQ